MDRFQIIIPMSGQGSRFKDAGFKLPKPLISVAGKPIIAYVIDLFPKETDFIFICNQDHLNNKNYKMRDIILKYCPTGKIYSIPSHKKGPVYAILEIQNHINLNLKTVVNYCDFTCYWDWQDFKKKVCENNVGGAVPAYKDFHPHSLGNTNYAYIKEKDLKLLDIQEKKPFTENKINEYASSGTYYFKNGQLMLDAFKEIIKKDLNVNGEFYVSMSYLSKVFKELDTLVYPIKYFMQWGTPQDLKEYKEWHQIFRKLSQTKKRDLMKMETLIMPMAGRGERFVREGYSKPKPMIEVSGKPMVLQSINFLGKFKNNCLVSRKDLKSSTKFNDLIKTYKGNVFIKNLEELSQGQANSCYSGLQYLNTKTNVQNHHITFGACDVGVIFNYNKLKLLLKDKEVDLIVWSRKTTASATKKPEMYGWIKDKNNLITSTSIKKPFKTKNNTSIITGIFTFKNQNVFQLGYQGLITKKSTINGEYYLDSIINELLKTGKKCVVFQVDHYLSWGTPNELKTFEYWESCFNLWKNHPYKKIS